MEVVIEILLGHMLFCTVVKNSNKNKKHEVTRDVTVWNYFKLFRTVKAQANSGELQVSKTKWVLNLQAKFDVEI